MWFLTEGKQLIQEKIRASPPNSPAHPHLSSNCKGVGSHLGVPPLTRRGWLGGEGCWVFLLPQREGRLLPPGVGDADLSPTSPAALPGLHGGLGPPPGRGRGGLPPAPGSPAAGAGRAEAAGVCAARRSQELTLLAGGSCAPCTSGGGLRPRPRPPPGLALPSRNAGSVRARIWSAFLGAAGAPSGAWPGAGGGRRPARISWLLPPLAAAVAPGQAQGAASTGKGGRTWPSPVVPGGAQWSGRPQGPSA